MEEERRNWGAEEAFAALMTAVQAKGVLTTEDVWPYLSMEEDAFEALSDLLAQERLQVEPLLPFQDEGGMERFFRELTDSCPEEKEAAQAKKKSPLYLYLKELLQTSPLSASQASGVWENAPDEGSAQAELTEGSLLFCLGMARRFAGRGILLLDLTQEASIELMLCAAEGETRDFYLRAARRIFGRMKELEEEMVPVCRVPQEQAEDLAKVVQAHRRLLNTSGREPTPAEVAAECGLKEDRVKELLALETLLARPEGSEEALPEAQDPNDPALQRAQEMLSALPETEARVLSMHFGLRGQPMDPQEIGAALGLSPEEVQEALQKGLKTLQEQGRKEEA